MEGPPKKIEKKKEEKSGFNKTVRATLAGAALLGAAAAYEASTEPDVQTGTKYEQTDTGQFEREINAFIHKIAAMDIGIDDARGRNTLRTKIEVHLEHFAPTSQARNNIQEHLLERIATYEAGQNPAIDILREIVNQTPTVEQQKKSQEAINTSPKNAGPTEGDDMGFQGSEIRKYKGDW